MISDNLERAENGCLTAFDRNDISETHRNTAPIKCTTSVTILLVLLIIQHSKADSMHSIYQTASLQISHRQTTSTITNRCDHECEANGSLVVLQIQYCIEMTVIAVSAHSICSAPHPFFTRPSRICRSTNAKQLIKVHVNA